MTSGSVRCHRYDPHHQEPTNQEDQMSATVTLPNTGTRKYPESNHAVVKDGHLHLMTTRFSDALVVAVYAPSCWAYFEVDAKEKDA